MSAPAKQGLLRPISVTQFLQNFQQSWSNSWPWATSSQQQADQIPRRLGIAVSGGADSMALTYLCKQLEKSQLVDGLVVKAFVVDHKAREESTREAQTVAGWLAEMDVDTEILNLQWPNSASVTAFETHARRLRFQSLGNACRKSQIETLLMGHHQNDNVETTLWRLCTGATGAGLKGIPHVARIPECHGLFGVSESGSHDVLRPRKGAASRNFYSWVHTKSKTGELCISFSPSEVKASTGGVLICRPLLSFPKSRLLDTCHHHEIPYVSDTTNFDPTLTPRNAIRSLLSSNKLPRGLQAPSILSLIERSRKLVRHSIELSNDLLQKCKILDFNGRVGTAIVQFPSSVTNPTSKDREIQALTLRRITEFLSPFSENQFPLQSFDMYTERVFPGTDRNEQPLPKQQAFTVGRVMFCPVMQSISSSDKASRSYQAKTNTWLLSRQPYMRNRLPEVKVEAPISDINYSNEADESTYSPWVLWDGRYWFRVRVIATPGSVDDENKPTIPMIIRPLSKTKNDLRNISHQFNHAYRQQKQQASSNPSFSSITPSIHTKRRDTAMPSPPPAPQLPMTMTLKSRQFQRLLSREAPGNIRFTIPVLVLPTSKRPNQTTAESPRNEEGKEANNNNQDRDQEEEEQLLALPTMDIRIPGSADSSRGWTVQWEWMYKSVDRQVLTLMGWLEEGRVEGEDIAD